MKKLILLFTVITLLAACKKEELVVVNGIVSGYIRDYNTKELLVGANIEYKIKNVSYSATTDSVGYFYISGLPIGSTILLISKAGFASYYDYIWIESYSDNAKIKDGATVDVYDAVDAELPKLDGSVSGIIKRYVGPNSEVRPAANFEITLRPNLYGYFPAEFKTTTNSRGEYSFDSVPSVYVYLYIGPFSDGDNNYSYQTNFQLSSAINKEFNVTVNREDKGIYLVSTSLDAGNGMYTTTYPVGNTITLTFNQTVSQANTIAMGTISLSGFVLDIENDVAYSGSVVTITTPADMAAATNYTLDYAIYSSTIGDYTSKTINFRTAD